MRKKEENRKLGLYTISMIGLMAALVFAGSKIEIRIPAVLGVTRVHLGNVMCVLSGFVLGAVPGGFAAGIGSFLFDLVFWPATPVEWLVTFGTKFVIGFVAGILLKRDPLRNRKLFPRCLVYGGLASLSYVVLYLLKSFVTYYFILQNPMPAVTLMLIEKGAASLFNAVIAAVVAAIAYMALWPRLRRAGIF